MNKAIPILLAALCFSPVTLADDLSILRLSIEQRNQLLSALETTPCTCGCGMTVGECLRDDPSCPVSPGIAREMVQRVMASNSPAAGPMSPTRSSSAAMAAGLDSNLIGGWVRRTAGGQDVYYENTLKMFFDLDGRVAYGSGVVISGGGSLGSVRGGGNNPVEYGRWQASGGSLHVSWDDGSTWHMSYEVFDYDGAPALMLQMNNEKVYFKSAR